MRSQAFGEILDSLLSPGLGSQIFACTPTELWIADLEGGSR